MTQKILFGTATVICFFAVLLLVLLLIWQQGILSRGRSTPVAIAQPTPYKFQVSSITPYWTSTLPPIAAYQIAIPADNQWHDTHIELRPGLQMLFSFLIPEETGHVELAVGKRHWDIYNPLAPQAWYEANFIAKGANNDWNTLLPQPTNLLIKSHERNIYLRVEIRNRR